MDRWVQYVFIYTWYSKFGFKHSKQHDEINFWYNRYLLKNYNFKLNIYKFCFLAPTSEISGIGPYLAKRRTANHPCPVCGKHYVNEGSLRKHMACHPETAQLASTLRMWPCSVCQAVFTHESGEYFNYKSEKAVFKDLSIFLAPSATFSCL